MEVQVLAVGRGLSRRAPRGRDRIGRREQGVSGGVDFGHALGIAPAIRVVIGSEATMRLANLIDRGAR